MESLQKTSENCMKHLSYIWIVIISQFMHFISVVVNENVKIASLNECVTHTFVFWFSIKKKYTAFEE